MKIKMDTECRRLDLIIFQKLLSLSSEVALILKSFKSDGAL